jgi:hypothetical protein
LVNELKENILLFWWWWVLGDDPVDLVRQEGEVDQSDSSLKMPLGVWNDRVAPVLT